MDDEQHYGLVMPFVCCTSNGGTLDDHAFVVGVRYGVAETELRLSSPDEWADYITPDMVAQYDLLAMHLGYTMTAEPWEEHPDDWVLVTFTKVKVDA